MTAKLKELTVFEHEKFGKVRTLVVDGEPWFVAKDVAKALGYSQTDQAIRNHCDDRVLAEVPSGKGGVQSTHVIPEWDMYSLVLGSRLPSAKVFKKWVCEEVLPSIRKTGSYSVVGQPDNSDLGPQFAMMQSLLDQAVANERRALAIEIAQEKIKEEQSDLGEKQSLTDDRVKVLEDREIVQPGEMTALQLASRAGWRTLRGGTHNLAVILAAINEEFIEKGLMRSKEREGPGGRTVSEFVFTPEGVAAFLREIDAQHRIGDSFTVAPNDRAKANGRKNRCFVRKSEG